jgi:hypothetical protein
MRKLSLLFVLFLFSCDVFTVPPLSNVDSIASDISTSSTETTSNITSTQTENVKILENELLHSDYIYYQGRHSYNASKKVETIYHTSSGFDLSFIGTSLTIEFDLVGNSTVYFMVSLDEEILPEGKRFSINKNKLTVQLFTNLENTNHNITLLKDSEPEDGLTSIKNIKTDGTFLLYQNSERLKFLCLGASGISGHGSIGLPDTGRTTLNSSSLHSFGYLTARMYKAEVAFVAQSGWGLKWGYNDKSGNVNIRTALDYIGIDQTQKIVDIPYDITEYQADYIIVNVGGNDYSSTINNASGSTQVTMINQFKESVAETCSYLLTKLPKAKIIWTYTSGSKNGLAAISAFSTLSASEQSRIFPTIIKQVGEDGDPEGADNHCSVYSHLKSAQLIANKLLEKANLQQLIPNYIYEA